VRDHDVLAAYLRGEQALLDRDADGVDVLVERLGTEAERARAQLLRALNSKRYLALLAQLEDAARAPRVVTDSPGLRELARREFRALRKTGRRASPESPDDELHRLRIKGKRARYTAELAAPALGPAADRFVRRAKSFQDLVGSHQDAVFAEAELRRLVAQELGGGAAVAAGRLIERQHTRRNEARSGLPKAWARLERSGRRAFS
jgi:CHAD domain-containing protein